MTARGQASLPALAVALLALTGAAVLGLTLASGALAGADRPTAERRTAVALADRLIAGDSPVTVRENVLEEGALSGLDEATVREQFPVTADVDVAVAIDGDRVLETDPTVRGPTMRRLVLLAATTERSITPDLGPAGGLTLPRRVDRATVTLSPPAAMRIETVRANDRVALHDPDGLAGTYTVELSRRETTRLVFVSNRTLTPGDVSLTVPTEQTRKTTLSVTVDG